MGVVASGINFLKSQYLNVTNQIQVCHKLDYSKHDLFLCNNIRLASCKKEPATVQWIESFGKDDIVFDIGANVGAFSLIMALYTKQVYSFEPAVTNFSILCKNIVENCRRKTIPANITPLNIALSQTTKLEVLNYTSLNLGTSGNQIGGRTVDNYGQSFQPTYSQKILAFDIDNLVRLFQLSVPNHIKIDVDGIELEILKGADHTLRNPAVKSVLVEEDIQSKEHVIIQNYLQERGFRLSSQHRADPTIESCCNCIYTR